MSFLRDLKEKKPLPVGGGTTKGSVSFFNNAPQGEEAFISSQGLVTQAGWRAGDESRYVVPGSLLFVLSPGDSLHKIYQVCEEDKTSYPEEAFLLVSLRREISGSGGNGRLKERLKEGDGQVVCAMAYSEANGQDRLTGEMMFPNSEVFPITILSASPQEVERAQKEGKQARVLWLSLSQEQIDACKEPHEPEEDETQVEDVLAVKTGETQEEAPAAPQPEGKKKKKTGLKAPAAHPLEQPQGEVVNF